MRLRRVGMIAAFGLSLAACLETGVDAAGGGTTTSSSSGGSSTGGRSSSSGGSSSSSGPSSSSSSSGSGSSTGGTTSSSSGSSSGTSGASSSSSGGGSRALTVSKLGAGTGTVTGSGIECGASCSGAFPSGTSVTLSANAASGSSFGGWGGACSGTAATCTVSMTVDRAVTASFVPATRPTTFTNPMLWLDLADVDVIRVDDSYYFMASNMHYSPGAPILRSYDLVNWEFAGHAVPTLDYGPAFDLTNGQAYIKGTWASFLNYRKSNKTFYFGGSIQGGGDLIYTAKSVEGPWEKHQIRGGSGYYDAGLLIDDDDTMYVAYGNTNISVAQLAADGFSQVKNQKVYTASGETIEGSRFYKRDGKYYILVTRPPDAEHVLRSTSGPFGPYEKRPLVDRVAAPVSGAGSPHQGGLVETQNGDWYYMGFIDAYPGGRVPVLAPVEWSADGWPSVNLSGGKWSVTYPFPNVPPSPRMVKGPTGIETFDAATLAHDWEWNHNPDNTKWSAGSGLVLQTATVTNDLYRARNTLTRRILGPTSTATIVLDHSGMKDGDRAGLAIFRHTTAWIGVRRDSGTTRLSMVNGLALSKSGWNTTSTGSEVASAAISGDKIWLRAAADIHPGTGKQVKFSYSTDGTTFTPFGAAFTMDNSWEFFMGYRYAIFNYATQALGGSVKVQSFELATP